MLDVGEDRLRTCWRQPSQDECSDLTPVLTFLSESDGVWFRMAA